MEILVGAVVVFALGLWLLGLAWFSKANPRDASVEHHTLPLPMIRSHRRKPK